MFCYNCGAHATPGQKFCRACGVHLSQMLPHEPVAAWPPTRSSSRWQILTDVLTDAIQTGLQYIRNPLPAMSDRPPQSVRYRHWGLLAFWAGVAALLGVQIGIVLIVAGIWMMAYARGFFSPAPQANATRSLYEPTSGPHETLSPENRRTDRWEKTG